MSFLGAMGQIEANWSKARGVEVEYIPALKFNPKTTKTKGFPAKQMLAEKQTDRVAKGQTVDMMNLASVSLDFKPLKGDTIRVYGEDWTIVSFSGTNPYDFVLEKSRLPTGERRHGFA